MTDQKWISVKDKLPELFNPVMIWDSLETVVIGYLSDASWYAYCVDDDPLLEVTHWMPLPEPPKEGAK